MPAPDLGNSPWHYVVVDAKFTTLHLLVGGQVGNSGSGPAYKAQLYVYNRALGRLQGYTPREAFLLGRGWDQTKKGVKSRGTNAMERLGPVTMAADIQAQVDLACEWLRRLRTEGADWSPLPTPTVSELWPTLGDGGFPWEKATSKIASELNDLTQLWYVGSDKRDRPHQRHHIMARLQGYCRSPWSNRRHNKTNASGHPRHQPDRGRASSQPRSRAYGRR